MRLTRHTLLTALFVAAVACACAAAAAEEAMQLTQELSTRPQHRCIHDKLMTKLNGAKLATVTLREPDANDVERDAATHATTWQPLRIGVFTEDLNDGARYCRSVGDIVPDHSGGTVSCPSSGILTPDKRSTLLDNLLPSAVKLHEKYLLVQRSARPLLLPQFTSGYCATFVVPSAHHTSGDGNVDFYAYIASTPTTGNVVAWAVPCAVDPSTNRPVAGASNIGTQYISPERETVRTVTHELLHALGFSQGMFPLSVLAQKTNIRLKPNAQSTFIGVNTVREAQKHYDCNTLPWMELEDEGGDGTAGSHWKRRNAKDELMAGIVGTGYYTAITIAAMEDLGYYKGNYAEAEVMPWGRGAGCNLLTNKCMTKNITQWPSMFCNDTSTAICTSDRRSLGSCSIATADPKTPVPSYFQYFTQSNIIGTPGQLLDYCPIAVPLTGGSCTGTNNLPGMATGANARCFDATNTNIKSNRVIMGVCADVKCHASSLTYEIKFQGASSYVNCAEGSTINIASSGATLTSGTVTCASYQSVCDEVSQSASSDGVSGRVAAHMLCALLFVVALFVAM